MDVQPGLVLEFSSDRNIVCVVQGANHVQFRGELVSFSRAAIVANSKRAVTARAMQGPIYRLFEGETLSARRDRFESDQQD